MTGPFEYNTEAHLAKLRADCYAAIAAAWAVYNETPSKKNLAKIEAAEKYLEGFEDEIGLDGRATGRRFR